MEELKLSFNEKCKIAYYCDNLPPVGDVCDVCKGSGSSGDGTCSACNGRGII